MVLFTAIVSDHRLPDIDARDTIGVALFGSRFSDALFSACFRWRAIPILVKLLAGLGATCLLLSISGYLYDYPYLGWLSLLVLPAWLSVFLYLNRVLLKRIVFEFEFLVSFALVFVCSACLIDMVSSIENYMPRVCSICIYAVTVVSISLLDARPFQKHSTRRGGIPLMVSLVACLQVTCLLLYYTGQLKAVRTTEIPLGITSLQVTSLAFSCMQTHTFLVIKYALALNFARKSNPLILVHAQVYYMEKQLALASADTPRMVIGRSPFHSFRSTRSGKNLVRDVDEEEPQSPSPKAQERGFFTRDVSQSSLGSGNATELTAPPLGLAAAHAVNDASSRSLASERNMSPRTLTFQELPVVRSEGAAAV